jgi:two-component system, LytTR family, sensor kinase
MMNRAHIDDDDRDLVRHFPRGRELSAIALFWCVFGVLSVANWFFPPFGDGPPFSFQVVAVSACTYVMWMVATPPLFWLTSRYSVERGDRARTIVFYLVSALLVAFAVDVLGELARGTFMPLSPRNGPNGGAPRQHHFWSLTRARLLNDYTTSLAIIAAGVARDYFTRYQRRLEESIRLRAQLAEAQLTALQSQLNPHFLFNTLNAVSALVDHDPRGVRRMIARLSEVLRAALEPSTDPEVPVSREIDILEKYLEILRIRFEGRLETSIDVEAGTREALLPPMILQPLVENSMKHAVSKTSGPSRIDIRVTKDDDMLKLMVVDTGAGNAPSIAPNAESGMGIGLRNTRARLSGTYDDDYSLDLQRTDEGGMSVTIRLPFHTIGDMKATPTVARKPG